MNETTITLAQRVAEHYDDCRGVNTSWVEFTNELGTLNLLGYLEDVNWEFVVDLLLDTEEFEDENAEELSAAVGEYLKPIKTMPNWVTAHDLSLAQAETGIEVAEIADSARAAGVPEAEVADFEETYA